MYLPRSCTKVTEASQFPHLWPLYMVLWVPSRITLGGIWSYLQIGPKTPILLHSIDQKDERQSMKGETTTWSTSCRQANCKINSCRTWSPDFVLNEVCKFVAHWMNLRIQKTRECTNDFITLIITGSGCTNCILLDSLLQCLISDVISACKISFGMSFRASKISSFKFLTWIYQVWKSLSRTAEEKYNFWT